MTFLWIDRDGYFMLLLTKYTVLYKENEICCIILLSLPSRERGLKSEDHPETAPESVSLPSRERGLKCFKTKKIRQFNSSLPSRERGLKLWIFLRILLWILSLPSWERGLKFVFIVVTVVGISRSLRGSMVANAVQNQTGIMPKAR